MSAGRPPDVPPTGAVNPYSPPAAAIDTAGVGAGVGIGASGYKSAAGLAKAIAILLLLDVLIEVAIGANSYLTIGVIHKIEAGEITASEGLQHSIVRFTGLGGLGFLVLVPIIVLFCLFMARANRNARAFGSPMSNTPGWAAGWFFIPFANWWKPYAAMKEIWQGSDPDPSVHAFQARVTPLLPWWWCAWLLRSLGGIAIRFVGKGGSPLQNLLEICQASVAMLAPSVAAALLAAVVVIAVARRQDDRQHRHPAGTPLPAASF